MLTPRKETPWLAALRSLLPRMRLVTLGVRVVLLHGDGVILVRHRFHDRARWYLPGGGVEAAEDALPELSPATERRLGEFRAKASPPRTGGW